MKSWNQLLPTVVAPLALLAFAGTLGPPQESAAVTRLQQEVANLRFRLDYETGRLERSVEDLQRRLQRTESRPVPAGTLPLPSSAPVPSPDERGEILAHRLVVTDGQGRARAALAFSDLFGPTLALMTASGDVAAMLSAPESGPRLELYDGAARVRVALVLDSDGARLRLLDPEGEVSGELGTDDGAR